MQISCSYLKSNPLIVASGCGYCWEKLLLWCSMVISYFLPCLLIKIILQGRSINIWCHLSCNTTLWGIESSCDILQIFVEVQRNAALEALPSSPIPFYQTPNLSCFSWKACNSQSLPVPLRWPWFTAVTLKQKLQDLCLHLSTFMLSIYMHHKYVVFFYLWVVLLKLICKRALFNWLKEIKCLYKLNSQKCNRN